MNTVAQKLGYKNLDAIINQANITDKDLTKLIPLILAGTQPSLEHDITVFKGVIEPHFYLFNGTKTIVEYKPDEFNPKNFQHGIDFIASRAKQLNCHSLVVMHTAKLGDTGQTFVYVVIFNKTHQLIFTKAFDFNPDENTVKFSEWDYQVFPISEHIINPDYRNIIAQ